MTRRGIVLSDRILQGTYFRSGRFFAATLDFFHTELSQRFVGQAFKRKGRVPVRCQMNHFPDDLAPSPPQGSGL